MQEKKNRRLQKMREEKPYSIKGENNNNNNNYNNNNNNNNNNKCAILVRKSGKQI